MTSKPTPPPSQLIKEGQDPRIKPQTPVLAMVVSPPNYVGGYRIGKEFEYSHLFNLTYKPNWLHRLFMRTCFGLYWFDK